MSLGAVLLLVGGASMGFERVEALSIRKPALHATRPAGRRLLPLQKSQSGAGAVFHCLFLSCLSFSPWPFRSLFWTQQSLSQH